MKETFPELLRRLAIAHLHKKLKQENFVLPENLQIIQLPKAS
ncbi:hypothetical protein [Anabaena sp. 90]|nr:hypothetical protein [Anabaena sp. 90]